MLFQIITLLAMSASVMAHSHVSRHRHHFKPSGSGKVIAPTGGTYAMSNSTSAYGPTGTGFGTDISAVPTETMPEYPVDTAIAPASNVSSDDSACTPGYRSTTTVYSTDLVTMTITAEDTITVLSSSASSPAVESSINPAGATVTTAVETETSMATAPYSATSSERSVVKLASTTTAETSDATYYASSPALMSSEATSSKSASPAETTDSPIASSEASYSTSPMSAPGEFYQASRSSSARSTTTAAPSVASSSSTAPASSSAAPVTTTVLSTGSYGTSKRGLAYNSAALTNAFDGKSMSWAYNWADNPSGTLSSGVEYVPMLWGQKKFSGWDSAAKSALANGAKHMLSFNEPDLAAQANMDSSTAAAAHIKYMNPYASQAKIGSPAITNGGPSGGTDGMGLGWMQNFFDKCAGNCKVDFLAFHWYDSATNVAFFKNYVQSVIDMAKKNGVSKVWLTEFAAAGSDDQVAKFMGEVLPWMDGNDAVGRYAYFMCGDGQLVSGNSMSAVGKAYAA